MYGLPTLLFVCHSVLQNFSPPSAGLEPAWWWPGHAWLSSVSTVFWPVAKRTEAPIEVQAQAQAADWAVCGCFCVAGAAKTVCSSVEEAQQNPALCPADKFCPPSPPETPTRPLTPPHPEAYGCETVSIWDENRQAMQRVKVCEVKPA